MMNVLNSFGTGGRDSPVDERDKAVSKRHLRQEAAKSKSGLWGPTHSDDTDDEDELSKRKRRDNSSGTSNTKEETLSSNEQSQRDTAEQTPLGRLYESATAAVESLVKSTGASRKVSPDSASSATPRASPTSNLNAMFQRHSEVFAGMMDDACSPCSNRPVVSPDRSGAKGTSPSTFSTTNNSIGIVPMVSPSSPDGAVNNDARVRSTESSGTPCSRRRQRYLDKLRAVEGPVPMGELTVHDNEAIEIERSISELTMRSSYGEATAKLAENRRMAYYAVGKHHKNSGRGGNRRCYFTGKLILGGTPFYAGSVQQGLRTLVVFCLPSAIGLPKGIEHLKREGSLSTFETGQNSNAKSIASKESSYGVVALPRALKPESSLRRNSSFGISRTGSTGVAGSRLSSLDDMTLSLEADDLDDNWGLDREYLLRILPAPSQDILDEMATRYSEQFETLPVQVRSPHCWRLFIKFCFFSGLPIAEGELHYKVRDEVANESYGEEIILSHEIMEAVNGESADMIRLPNTKTFRYLKKHYTQQSGKLSEDVYKRTSWEIVLPEI